MSGHDYGSSPSAIGDDLAQQIIYMGFNVQITFAGTIVAGTDEIKFNVNNNVSLEPEMGSRHPMPVSGIQEVRGTMRGFYFDSTKFRLALGKIFSQVATTNDGVVDSIGTSFKDTYSFGTDGGSPAFGNPDWFRLFRFDIAANLKRAGTGTTTSYIARNVLIDTWGVTIPRDGKVMEDISFVASSLEKLES